MTQLGNEECELCTKFHLHKQSCECDVMCSKYTAYIIHKRKLVQACKEYKRDAPLPRNVSEAYVSADLQKVIIIPQMNQF